MERAINTKIVGRKKSLTELAKQRYLLLLVEMLK
jgi:hypothetical protein